MKPSKNDVLKLITQYSDNFDLFYDLIVMLSNHNKKMRKRYKYIYEKYCGL